MNELIPSPVLLAVFQNQIKKAIEENKINTDDFVSAYSVEDMSNLSSDEHAYIFDNKPLLILETVTDRVFIRSSERVYSCISAFDSYNVNIDSQLNDTLSYLFCNLSLISQNKVTNYLDTESDDNIIFPYYLIDNHLFTNRGNVGISRSTYRLATYPEFKNDAKGTVSLFTTDAQESTTNFAFNEVVLKANYRVVADSTGAITSTPLVWDNQNNMLPEPSSLTLTCDKYPNVVFYANYYNAVDSSIVYRFSSGVIVDTSADTHVYKIVLASYNVRESKVDFVEKVLA